MATTMLIELWEQICGYDKWVETEAIVESSAEKKTSVIDRFGNTTDTWTHHDVIVWADAHGEKQHADFTVDDRSRLFRFIDGNSLKIRYDPSRLENFYFRELFQYNARRAFRAIFALLVLISIFVWLAWSLLTRYSK